MVFGFVWFLPVCLRVRSGCAWSLWFFAAVVVFAFDALLDAECCAPTRPPCSMRAVARGLCGLALWARCVLVVFVVC